MFDHTSGFPQTKTYNLFMLNLIAKSVYVSTFIFVYFSDHTY